MLSNDCYVGWFRKGALISLWLLQADQDSSGTVRQALSHCPPGCVRHRSCTWGASQTEALVPVLWALGGYVDSPSVLSIISFFFFFSFFFFWFSKWKPPVFKVICVKQILHFFTKVFTTTTPSCLSPSLAKSNGKNPIILESGFPSGQNPKPNDLSPSMQGPWLFLISLCAHRH